MAHAEPSMVTATPQDGEDGGRSEREANSGVAGDHYVTASALTASSHESCEYQTVRMGEVQVQAAIEKSREQGWSELADRDPADAVGRSSQGDDALIWAELKRRDPRVFADYLQVQLGRLIAERGQAHVYEARINDDDSFPLVAKVYKREGFSLADLQRQWPLASKTPASASAFASTFLVGDFVSGEVVFGEFMSSCSYIHLGTFLEDGRFAFLMERCRGDLRTLINLKLSDNNGPPFSHPQALQIMHQIARGMSQLHCRGVQNRDLKAANILVFDEHHDSYDVADFESTMLVADFESSMLVQGTGFWRAPEVLQELLKKPCDRNEQIWTEKVDVYSYAMTCYEVLTGHVPFYGYVKRDWKRVIDGERSHLPDYVVPQVREIVERCWHKEASNRPTFEIIECKLKNMRESIVH